MRAVVLHSPGRLDVAEIADPTPAPDEAVVRVVTTGICGSDLHMLQGERSEIPLPVVMGHEIGGRVETLPAGYSGPLGVGDVVAIEPYLWCGTCVACREGQWAHCGRFTAYGVHRQGGLAEWLAVPPQRLHPMADVGADIASLVEPLSIGAMAVARSGAGEGDQVVVMGAGPIGLAVLLSARSAGARVLIVDRLASRLELATTLGAELAFDAAGGDVAEAIADWAGPDGVSIVFEATGVASVAAQCVELVRATGQVVVVGLSSDSFAVPVRRLVTHGVTVLGSRAGLFAPAVRLAVEESETVAKLVSHRFALIDAAAAFAQAIDRPADTVKVLVDV